MISPVGEPGAGKSTFSFWLTHALKMRGVRAEFVPEVIKYESYSPEAMARVVSGRYDSRLLAKQHAFAKPLIGKVEVIVNDGALEPFFYYSLLRVGPDRLPSLRAQLKRYIDEQGAAEHRYVTPVRQHAYDTNGRRQTEAESLGMRTHLLETLRHEFGIVPVELGDQAMREAYADALAQEVFARRPQITPSGPTRRRARQP